MKQYKFYTHAAYASNELQTHES